MITKRTITLPVQEKKTRKVYNDGITRKDSSKMKISCEYKRLQKLKLIVFTMEKPFYQVALGATDFYSFEKAENISERIQAIFKNSTTYNCYCLVDDINKALGKLIKDKS